jgi:hypothetical protein
VSLSFFSLRAEIKAGVMHLHEKTVEETEKKNKILKFNFRVYTAPDLKTLV